MGTRGQCSDGLGSRGVGARDVAAREAASDLLRALASPMRIAIVLALQEDARCVHELVGSLGVSQPLVSQHLRVLKDAGVVSGERNGREIMYSLVDHHIVHIADEFMHTAGLGAQRLHDRDACRRRERTQEFAGRGPCRGRLATIEFVSRHA